jgi:hypothetical protein
VRLSLEVDLGAQEDLGSGRGWYWPFWADVGVRASEDGPFGWSASGGRRRHVSVLTMRPDGKIEGEIRRSWPGTLVEQARRWSSGA